DEIVAIDGRRIKRFEDIRREVMVGLDTTRTFTIIRGGETIDIQATPEKFQDEDHFGFKHSRGLLGLVSAGNAIEIDRIVSIDGIAVENVDETRRLLLEKMGQTFSIELDRGPAVDTLFIQPLREKNEALTDPESAEYGHLVIAGGDAEIIVRHGALSGFME